MKGRKKDFILFNLDNFKTDIGYYIIGYLLGDGCITNNPKTRTYNFQVYTIDYETVENFKKFFKDRLRIYKEGKKCLNCHNGWRLKVNDKDIINYLISIGITTKKSKTCKLNIPYNWNILRGYFDADGTVRKPPRKECSIASNSMKSLQQLINFTKTGKIEDNDWVVRGFNNMKFIFDNMYKHNPNVKLTRKYNIFKNVIEMGGKKQYYTRIILTKGEEQKVFDSLREASEYFNINYSTISTAYGRTKTFRGYDLEFQKYYKIKE